MNPKTELAARIRRKTYELSECTTREGLDDMMDTASIEIALEKMPAKFSEMLVLYALNRERVARNLPRMPATVDDESVVEYAIDLAGLYLIKIGFLLSYHKGETKFDAAINPDHPKMETISNLEKTLPFINEVACFFYAGAVVQGTADL